jgi:putative transposase
MYFNRTHKHLGPVFQNRFKSLLIESDSYFLKLSQYIYLNPIKGGLVSDPLLYKYSSLREALGKEPFLILDKDIIRLVGGTKNSLKEYETFIRGGLKEDFSEIERLFEKEEAVLGTSKFAVRSQRKYLRRRSKKYA